MSRRKDLSKAKKAKLRTLNAGVCCVCKRRDIGINFHHIDHNPSNNDVANIAVLCVQDHDAHHRPSEYAPMNHMELGVNEIRACKREWEDFVNEAQKTHPKIFAVLNVYGTYEQIHSFRLLFQNGAGHIFLERLYHILTEPRDKCIDRYMSELDWLGPNIKLALVNSPLPIDYCPCCEKSLANTVNPDVAEKILAGDY
jgi:hypothetical protein